MLFYERLLLYFIVVYLVAYWLFDFGLVSLLLLFFVWMGLLVWV